MMQTYRGSSYLDLWDQIRVVRRKKEHALAKQQKEDPEPMRKWFTMKPKDDSMDTASSAQDS